METNPQILRRDILGLGPTGLAFVLVLEKEGNCVKLSQFQCHFQSMDRNSTVIPLIHVTQ